MKKNERALAVALAKEYGISLARAERIVATCGPHAPKAIDWSEFLITLAMLVLRMSEEDARKRLAWSFGALAFDASRRQRLVWFLKREGARLVPSGVTGGDLPGLLAGTAVALSTRPGDRARPKRRLARA